MLVRVLIDRHTKPGREKEALDLILGLRTAATKQPGNVLGETLVDAQDPRHILILGTWHALDDWRRWESSEEHRRLASLIAPLLEEPGSVRICVNPWDALVTE